MSLVKCSIDAREHFSMLVNVTLFQMSWQQLLPSFFFWRGCVVILGAEVGMAKVLRHCQEDRQLRLN